MLKYLSCVSYMKSRIYKENWLKFSTKTNGIKKKLSFLKKEVKNVSICSILMIL